MTFQLCTGMDIKTALIIFIVGVTNLFGQSENAMIVEMKTGVTHPDANEEHPSQEPRWVNINMASLSTRYHFVQNSAGATTANSNQYQQAYRGQFKFDSNGKFAINAAVFSGRGFTASWNNSGWGTGRIQTNLFLKQLYVSAKPLDGVDLEYGGLSTVYGVSTEITSYDYDSYLDGQRVRLHRPDRLFFDAISVTYAYVGDANIPNVSKRLRRLKESNYHQFLIEKNVHRDIKVSADYAFDSGTDFLHEAIRVKNDRLRIVDFALFENYQILGNKSGYGFGLYGEKSLHRRVRLGAGYADINHDIRNSDRFGVGRRIYWNGHLTITRELSFATYLTHGFGTSVKNRVDLVFNYNILANVRRVASF